MGGEDQLKKNSNLRNLSIYSYFYKNTNKLILIKCFIITAFIYFFNMVYLINALIKVGILVKLFDIFHLKIDKNL